MLRQPAGYQRKPVLLQQEPVAFGIDHFEATH
jgi:hypothetical protein